MTGDQASALRPGDLVEYLPTGEWWTVDEVVAAPPCKPQRFVLGRSEAADGNVVRAAVTDALPGQLRLVRKALERTLFKALSTNSSAKTLEKARVCSNLLSMSCARLLVAVVVAPRQFDVGRTRVAVDDRVLLAEQRSTG